jgi:hypothetical protein
VAFQSNKHTLTMKSTDFNGGLWLNGFQWRPVTPISFCLISFWIPSPFINETLNPWSSAKEGSYLPFLSEFQEYVIYCTTKASNSTGSSAKTPRLNGLRWRPPINGFQWRPPNKRASTSIFQNRIEERKKPKLRRTGLQREFRVQARLTGFNQELTVFHAYFC